MRQVQLEFALWVCLVTEGTGQQSGRIAQVWRIVDATKRVEVRLLEDVKVKRFASKDEQTGSPIDLTDLFRSGVLGAFAVVWQFLPVEHGELGSICHKYGQISDVALNWTKSAIGGHDVGSYVPTEVQRSRHPIIVKEKTPLDWKVGLEGLHGRLDGVQSHPSPLAHLKVSGIDLISGQRSVPLASVNDYGIYAEAENPQLDHRLPRWCLIWLAGLAFGVALWGWHNLRNDRRITMGFWAFILGMFGWGFALSGILQVSLF